MSLEPKKFKNSQSGQRRWDPQIQTPTRVHSSFIPKPLQLPQSQTKFSVETWRDQQINTLAPMTLHERYTDPKPALVCQLALPCAVLFQALHSVPPRRTMPRKLHRHHCASNKTQHKHSTAKAQQFSICNTKCNLVTICLDERVAVGCSLVGLKPTGK
jgi:hypothetical protein